MCGSQEYDSAEIIGDLGYKKEAYMSISRKVFGDLAEIILEGGAKKATKFFNEREVVKACRRGKIDKRSRQKEILFTIGSPNYKERQFIKKAKKSGEPFPIKKILIKWPTVREGTEVGKVLK